MQWYNVSYDDPSVRRKVEQVCGRPFSLCAALRMGGTGTARMRLSEASGTLMAPFDREEDRRYLSIEVRQDGLLLRCRSRLETMGLPISWTTIASVELAAPGPDGSGMLSIVGSDGGTVVMHVGRDHWGSVCRLLRRTVPEGRFRTRATLVKAGR